MKTLLVFSILLTCTPFVYAQTVDVYFGTGTSEEAIGIFHAKFDTDTGKLAAVTLAAKIKQPEFLALHPDRMHLYAVAQSNQPVIAAYKIEADGQLRLLNTVPMSNGQGAHVSVHPSGKLLLTAQYFAGSVGVFKLATDGTIEKQTQVIHHTGPSRVHDRQSAPHPHWTGFSPDGKFALVPDLGTDKIHLYHVDADGALLTAHGHADSISGGGPRHMRFSTDGRFIHLLNELHVSISTFRYDAATGSATLIHTTPTLDEKSKSQEPYVSASEILVHPCGKFVYSANRGHDSITAFTAEPENGTLTPIDVEHIRGSWPRHIRLDPAGKWLFASGEASNTVSIFSIDQETGELSFPTGNVTNVPTVYCILFRE